MPDEFNPQGSPAPSPSMPSQGVPPVQAAPQMTPNQEPPQGFMPPGATPPAGMPVSGPQGGSNKSLFIALGVVALIIVGVLGYGFWNGSRVKAYATRAEEIVLDSEGWLEKLDNEEIYENAVDFNENKLYSLIKDLEDQRLEYDRINIKADNFLLELTERKSPKKTQQLEKDLEEYLKLSKQLAEEGIYGIDLFNSALDFFQDIVRELSKKQVTINSDLSSKDTMALLKKEVDIWLDNLKKLKVPDSMNDIQDKVIKSVEDLSLNLEKGDVEAIKSVKNPFESIDEQALQQSYEDAYLRVRELKASLSENSIDYKTKGFVLF